MPLDATTVATSAVDVPACDVHIRIECACGLCRPPTQNCACSACSACSAMSAFMQTLRFVCCVFCLRRKRLPRPGSVSAMLGSSNVEYTQQKQQTTAKTTANANETATATATTTLAQSKIEPASKSTSKSTSKSVDAELDDLDDLEHHGQLTQLEVNLAEPHFGQDQEHEQHNKQHEQHKQLQSLTLTPASNVSTNVGNVS